MAITMAGVGLVILEKNNQSQSRRIVRNITPKGVLLALHYIPTGIASTIMSLVPVCLIPFAIFLHKEHVSVKAITGALIAVFGIYFLSA